MADKKTIEIILAGEVYKISGEESEDHMNRVSEYLGEKLGETRKALSGRGASKEQLLAMTAINVCDDFIKLAEHAKSVQERLNRAEKREKQLKESLDDYEAELLRLEQENMLLKEKQKESELAAELAAEPETDEDALSEEE